MSGPLKGMIIGLTNTVVVAFCIALGLDEVRVIDATFFISFFGAFPALLVGAALGQYGETKQTANRRVMLVCMIAVACSTVALLGLVFDLPAYVLVSCIPTAAGCAILERWTRAKPELPVARVA